MGGTALNTTLELGTFVNTVAVKNHPFKKLVAHHKCATPFEYIIEILPKCSPTGPWIAGGALLRTYTGQPLDSDVDVFFQNKEQCDRFITTITSGAYGGSMEDRKKNQYTVETRFSNQWHTTITMNYMGRDWKIQCITFVFFKTINELFESFDFDVCMMAYDGNELYVNNTTFDAIENKMVKLMKINYPSITLKRLVKYMRQGYNVDDADVTMLVASFRGPKEPVGIMDESGENGGRWAKISKTNDWYINLRR